MAVTVTVEEASSSSGSTPQCSYHVFLSFRGEDTRRGFTDHLFAALQRKGIKTFKDDRDLERGQVIKAELLKAIEESMFAVIVLSPNYASSTWCLDELQKIVECNHNLGLQIMPIFYEVEPRDVRHQTGSFAEAFKTHEEIFRHDRDKVKRWRDALTQVANFSGWNSKEHQHEATLVERIVVHIHQKLIPKLSSGTKHIVDIASMVEEVTSLLRMGLNVVRFVAIYGKGGVGKTTIARGVYEMVRNNFEASCFLENIRKESETKGLLPIQRDLLSSLDIRSNNVRSLDHGRKAIKDALWNKKILLVLDGVSEVSQLKDLAGNQDWFGPGSRVIITTRYKLDLRKHGVHGTYEIGGSVQNVRKKWFVVVIVVGALLFFVFIFLLSSHYIS